MSSKLGWSNPVALNPREFICGFCNKSVASDIGWYARADTNICSYLCPNCGYPTFFDSVGLQHPAIKMGNSVQHLPAGVEELYEEARSCTSYGNYTAAVMLCRKLLMNLAVEEGAPENKKFAEYVDYLGEIKLVPPKAQPWLVKIKDLGNEANHEITSKTKEDAEIAIGFLEIALRFNYEVPAMSPQ